MSKALIIIPARMSSSRFPGKPLININGKTMLERVWSCAVKANIGDVYVACCDKLVKELLIKKEIPTGRLGHIDDLTKIYLSLLCDSSSYITGTNIVIDGGISAYS